MSLDFSVSNIDIKIVYFAIDILVFLIMVYFYYRILKYYKDVFDISAMNYIKSTVSQVIIKLPIKWFDWLKFVIIIGTLSALNAIFYDKYILLIIYISYIALFLDFYYFIYDFTITAIQKPAEESLNKTIADLEPLEEDLLKYSNLEDIIQYKPTSALTEKDVLDRKLISIIDLLIINIRDLKNNKKYLILSLKGMITFFALILTLNFYLLINHFLSLYLSNKPT